MVDNPIIISNNAGNIASNIVESAIVTVILRTILPGNTDDYAILLTTLLTILLISNIDVSAISNMSYM